MWLIGCASLMLGSWIPQALAKKPAGVLSVSPTNALASSGFLGGPFSPSSQIYTLTNSGNASLSWAASNDQNWLSLSATGGTLTADSATAVTASINSNANALAVGNWAGMITFTNLTNGKGGTAEAVSLAVGPIPAPSALIATTVSAREIDLTWTDNGNSQFEFKIERSVDGTNFTQIAQVLTNTTAYLDTGGWPSTTYYYRVRAGNAASSSAYSNVATARSLDLRPTAIIDQGLTPPTGVTDVVAIAAGAYHSLAVRSDGTVISWGDNTSTQATPVAGLTGVVAVAAGHVHSLALESGGTVVAWGDNSYGQATVPAGLSDVVAIAAGDYHSLALKSDGTVVGWGYNGNGAATAPAGLSGVVAIAGGWTHSLALKSDGTLVGWGDNNYGETTPPLGATGLVAVAGGVDFSVVLKSDGTVIAWGENMYGETTPPTNLTGVVAISAKYTSAAALKGDGTVATWGQWPTPTGLSNVVAISMGDSHFLTLVNLPTAPSGLTATAISPTQINLTWTNNANDEDGFKVERSTDGTNFTQIAQVLPDTTVYRNTGLWPGTQYYYRVSAYDTFGDSDPSNVAGATTSNLCSSGVVGWGYNSNGQVVPPAGLSNVVAIAAGIYHSLALKTDGTIVGWGDNTYGESTSPPGLTGVVAISAGWNFSMALKSDGTVVVWGDNSSGQTNPPPGLAGVVAISANWSFCLALKSDGTVVGWGQNTSGQLYVPSGLSGVVAVAAGWIWGLALESDGTVVGWGSNAYGQVPPPAGLNNVVALAAGASHSLALKSDGTVVAWGDNSFGQATPPSGLSNVVAIAANGMHSLALKSDSTVVWWGDNDGGAPPSAGAEAIATGYLHSLALVLLLNSPTGLTATAASSNEVDLAWVSMGSSDGFTIQRAPDNGGSPGTWTQIVTVGSNISAYADTGLSSDTRYWYQVQAFDSCGVSAFSDQVNATPPSIPIAPTGLTATAAGECQINVIWVDNSFNEVSFLIERALDNGGVPGLWTQIATVGSNVTSYSDTGLSPNVTYWYRVRASNVAGYSAYSNQGYATAPPIPAPSGLTATGVSESQIVLNWTNNSVTATGVLIERAPDSGGTPGAWNQIASVGTNIANYSDTGLLPFTTYWYRVRAYNAAGNSDYSSLANATTQNIAAPSGLTAIGVASNQIDLAWANNSSYATGFAVERAPDNAGAPGTWSPIATTSSNVTIYSDVGLLPNTPYWYRVRAVTATLTSDYSNQAKATTLPLPPVAPTNLTATAVSGSQISLSWMDTTNDETGFAIESAPDIGGVPGTFSQIATVNSNVITYLSSGLTTNTTYWYRVRASNVGGYSPYSNLASARTLAGSVDSWYSPNSGKWESSSNGGQIWSLLVPPNVYLSGALITNDVSKTVTIDATTVSNAPGSMTISNLTLTGSLGATNTLLLSTAGTNTPLHVLQAIEIGSGGVLDVEDSSLQMDFLNSKAGFTIDGTLLFENGGKITLGTRGLQGEGASPFVVGNVATGLLVVSSGTISAGGATIGDSAGSQGTLVISNSATLGLSSLSIGQVAGSTGAVWMSGGQLSTTNGEQPNAIYVGYWGCGLMAISNGTVLSGRVYVAAGAGSGGTLTVAGGGLTASSSLYLGYGAMGAGPASTETGVLRVTGGQLTVTNGGTAIGYYGAGQLTVTGGVVRASSVTVGQYAGSQGALVVSGGAISIGSSLVIGDCATTASGQVTVVSSGSLFVTNASHTAFLDVRHGTLTMTTGAVLQVDTLVMTNSCGLLVPGGGTLNISNLVLDPNLSALGDGIPNGWKQQYGLNPLDPNLANKDLDGTGFTVLQDYLAGLDPTNASSALHITGIALVGADVRVFFTSVAGKYYALGRCIFLGGPWTDIVTNIPGTSGIQWVKDIGGAAQASAFYRVELEQLTTPPPADSDGDGLPDLWTEAYFGHPTGQSNDLSCAGCDADGTEQNNLSKYLAGLNPTSPDSVFRIIAISQANGTNTVTWKTSGGDVNALSVGSPTIITNIVQGSVGTAVGGYSNDFSDISGPLIIVPPGNTVTNFTDGAGTNRFYRIRLGP